KAIRPAITARCRMADLLFMISILSIFFLQTNAEIAIEDYLCRILPRNVSQSHRKISGRRLTFASEQTIINYGNASIYQSAREGPEQIKGFFRRAWLSIQPPIFRRKCRGNGDQ